MKFYDFSESVFLFPLHMEISISIPKTSNVLYISQGPESSHQPPPPPVLLLLPVDGRRIINAHHVCKEMQE